MDGLSFASVPCGNSAERVDLVPRCDSHRKSCGAHASTRRLAGVGSSRAAGAIPSPVSHCTVNEGARGSVLLMR